MNPAAPRAAHLGFRLGLLVACAGLQGCMEWVLTDRRPVAPVEVCDGIDNTGDGRVDEGFPDADGDGIADCVDVEVCDGVDNTGDGSVDEGFPDADGDGIADCVDVEDCDGIDNTGDGSVDEGFPDADGDDIADCMDAEECDSLDNNGDGRVDEGFPDTDDDGIADCIDFEACDGLDNDGDGQIDEDFPDVDVDGVADCVDDTCVVSLPLPGFVPTRPECDLGRTTPVAEPWRVRVKWQWTGWSEDPNYRQVVATPLVGRTLPDNAGVQVVVAAYDGAAPSSAPGALVRLDGASGLEVGSAIPVARGRTGVLMWDELAQASGYVGWRAEHGFAVTPDQEILAFEGLSAAALAQGCHGHAAASLGLHGGRPAFQACYGSWDPTTGALIGEYVAPTSALDRWGHAHALPSADGTIWLANAGAFLAPDWSAVEPQPLYPFLGWSIPVAVGLQPGPALLAGPTQSGKLLRIDVPGAATSSTFATLTGSAFPPCLGDIDADGRAELVVPSHAEVIAFDLRGRVRWTAPVEDRSSAASCSLYDLDGDGAMEVLHAGQDAFRILDGRTGAERFVDWEHSSWTAIEYPVIADLDGDGHAEIIVVSNNNIVIADGWTDPLRTRAGVTVYEHDGHGWASAEPGWPVWHWSRRDVDYRGRVITEEVPWTQEHNLLRAGPMPDISRPELSVRVAEGCVATCRPDGVVSLAVEVANAGAVGAPATWVTVWQEQDGAWVPALTVDLGPLASGERRSHVLDVTLGEGALLVRINDDGSGALAHECDLTNNEAHWEATACAG